jgi:cobalamin synthase
MLNKASRYFPLIGWIVGTFAFALFMYSISFGIKQPFFYR